MGGCGARDRNYDGRPALAAIARFRLGTHAEETVERLDLPVVLALGLGAYQLRFLEKVPASAAVNESVELVKMARKTSAASLVNAVLRKMTSEAKSPAEIHLPPNLPAAERLGITHSHPKWMVERWSRQMGETQTIAPASKKIIARRD